MTTNAAGNDEWVGIDDIVVSSLVSRAEPVDRRTPRCSRAMPAPRRSPSPSPAPAPRSAPSPPIIRSTFGSGPFDANAGDFAAGQPFTGMVSFADGQTSADDHPQRPGRHVAEGDESFTVTLSNAGRRHHRRRQRHRHDRQRRRPADRWSRSTTSRVAEGDGGTSMMTFTVTRTGGTGAFNVDYRHRRRQRDRGPSDYVATSGTLNFAAGQNSADDQRHDQRRHRFRAQRDASRSCSPTPTNGALITDAVGIGTIVSDDPIFIHDIQGTAYFSPILAGEGITQLQHRLGRHRHRPRGRHRGRQCRPAPGLLPHRGNHRLGRQHASRPRASS